ncbi:hypothetical protein OFM15_29970, partial [Escherichia coli]|nr:hypothetical protein [Escherichia coli]
PRSVGSGAKPRGSDLSPQRMHLNFSPNIPIPEFYQIPARNSYEKTIDADISLPFIRQSGLRPTLPNRQA